MMDDPGREPAPPAGFDFINDLEDAWEAPDELRDVGVAKFIVLATTIMRSAPSNQCLALIGRAVTSYALFNQWVAVGGGRALGFEGLGKASGELSFILRDLYSAWCSYRDARENALQIRGMFPEVKDVVASPVADLLPEIENLTAALEDSLRRLEALRQGF